TITDQLDKVDSILMRINLLLLLFVSFIPFPTRLVAEGIHSESGERVYVTMYGLTLLLVRVMLFVLDEDARREHLYSPTDRDHPESVRQTILPTLIGYVVAIGVGIVFPAVAVGLYCVLAIFLVIPFRELGRVLFHRS